MSNKLTRKVKLPKEESSDNENKGRDPKDEPSSTSDREEDTAEIPELFARSNERFFYDEKEETIWRMQEKIDEYEKQIQRAKETIKEQEEDKIETIKKITEALPSTPGPNLMRPKTPRAQDLAYKAILEATEKEKNEGKTKTSDEMLTGLVMNLAASLKASTKVDIAIPPKFKGDDTKWESWYKQLRAYLQAKGWLKTFDHPIGAGAMDFDIEINSSIYNLLMNLCNNGKASTYLEGAAEFDGRGAGLALIARYDGFSKQKLVALKSCIERLRHINGTNMSDHIDKFETLCTQMTSCGKAPDEEQKIDWFLDSVHEHTYAATHAHCTNKMLEGDLTYAMLIKMYTNQCFSKYPHFQLADLNDGKKFSNNANKFRSAFAKGKQGKGKGKDRGMVPYRRWRDEKEKRGNRNHQWNRSKDQEKTYTQNSNQAKGKGNGKGFKGKGKGKGKPRYGDRKKDSDDKNNQNNEKKPVTNNMQKVYLDEPHRLGDDETTIVFTQNTTRIVVKQEGTKNEDDNELIANETNEYEGLTLELAPTFGRMIKEIMNLPDDHEAWAYMNPTAFYFDDRTSPQNLHEKAVQHVKDFQNWLDGTLFINQELKEKTNHLQPSQNEMTILGPTIDESTLRTDEDEQQGSSSVETEQVRKISWGERQTDNNEESLRLWLQTNKPKAQKKNEGTDDDTNLEESTLCSVCDQEMLKIRPGTNTCQGCQQWVLDCKGLVENKVRHTRDNMTDPKR
jgi:hypothetical protein